MTMKASVPLLHANTLAELQAKLATLNIKVPPRSEGGRTQQVERYCVAHLLAVLSATRLDFPLALTHRDRPDFLLDMAGLEIGIEHTEAVPKNAAAAQAMRERGVGPEVYFPGHAMPGEPKRTSAEIRREIEADLSGDGWVGDSPEREWAEAMAYYVNEKLPKAQAEGFARYAINWLIVYDNWPVPAVDYGKASAYLTPRLAEMNAFAVFDAIFVHDTTKMCEFRDAPIIHALIKPDSLLGDRTGQP
ncbi:TPA: hypothetical protein SH296_001915 [Pseudomonas aeruginosa]|nr:hypothetical protein [Pseudomonas aeruginosa]HEH8432032.1 hypothetical protein [Pseudomonas aeruginosa]HEH8533583.1 hypothetical protein [Pseudomonas aeruginosa]HEH8759610.1 hypothetical protein [Pseudomonas aeruginosa]